MSANQRYADAASDIYLKQGEIAGQDIARRGQIWGGAISQIGQIAGQTVTGFAGAKQDEKIHAIFEKYGADFEKAIPEVMAIDPDKGMKIADQVFKQQKWAYDLQDEAWKAGGRKLLKLRELLDGVQDQGTYTAALYGARLAGLEGVDGADPTYDPAKVAQWKGHLQQAYQTHQGAVPAKPEPFTLGRGQTRFDPAGNEIASVPPEDESAKVPSPGTTAHEAYIRKQTIMAGESGGMPQPGQQPPPLSVAQVEGRAPAPPPPTPAMTDEQAWLKAYEDQRAATKKDAAVSYQSKPVLLDGKPALVGFKPDDNTYWKNGVDVSARVKDVPPQSVDGLLHELRQVQLEVARRDAHGATPKETATFNQIAAQYERSPLIKAADRTLVLDDAVKAVKADPTNATNQLNLAYAYIAALDTYQSAVREGELKNLGMLGTKLQQLGVTVDRLVSSGAFIPPGLARDIATSGEQLVKTIKTGRDQKQREFASRARVSGIEGMWTDFVKGFEAPPTETGAVPKDGTEGVVNGVPAVWKTVNGKAGWYKK